MNERHLRQVYGIPLYAYRHSLREYFMFFSILGKTVKEQHFSGV